MRRRNGCSCWRVPTYLFASVYWTRCGTPRLHLESAYKVRLHNNNCLYKCIKSCSITVILFRFIAILSYFDVFRYAEHNRAHKNPVFAWICRPAASMWALVPFSAKFWPLTMPLLKFFLTTAWYLKKVTDLVLFILFIVFYAIDQLTVTVFIIAGMRVILQGLCANATCRKLDLKVKHIKCKMFQ